jgi:hypothetical protein
MRKGFDLKCGAGKTARVWLQGKGGGLTPGQALVLDIHVAVVAIDECGAQRREICSG